jgi:plasmid stabilization system protein ParE
MAHRVSEQAAADLDDIWYYFAKEGGSLEIASRLIDAVINSFFLLARQPYLGRSRDDDFGGGIAESFRWGIGYRFIASKMKMY